MKRFILITAAFAAFTVLFTANAEAGRRRLFQPRYPRVMSYWSPGVFTQYLTQGMGGPRMVWRGDWVPARRVR